MSDPLEDILKKASEGDLNAFESIYKSTSQFVYNVAFRIVSNREDAEEVTQEVFLNVYHSLKEFRFQSSFKTWVYRIAVNCALNRVKKTSKERSQTVEYDERLNPVATAHAAEAQMEKEHNEKMITWLLQSLNPDQRSCVVLRNMQGLSYQEIADVLKINVNTVRSRLKRAREALMNVKKEAQKNAL
ncbi:MAG: RNA polymerase sigma factor [Candidatus Omnitrophica bacterium]|nr:RNA polymerase sigma factor [Candidatus Omnitrophota bacterium]